MNKFTTTAFVIVFSISNMIAQNSIGRVVDSKSDPIDAVAVILQTTDSTYLDATISDESGYFSLPYVDGSYMITFQHILYETFSAVFDKRDLGAIVMKEKNINLDEVVVKGERRYIKAENGLLSLDYEIYLRK